MLSLTRAIHIAIVFKFALIAAVKVHAPCITPMNTTGKCVDLQDCTFLFEVLKLPDISPKDRHYLRASQCGNDHAQVYICCTDEYINYKIPTVITNTIKAADLNVNLISRKATTTTEAIPILDFQGDYIPVNETILPEPPVCGTLLTRHDQKFQDHPWTALLVYSDAVGKTVFYCVGTLITNQHVLIAAHCLTQIPREWNLISVRLGESVLRTNPDCVELENDEKYCADPYVEIEVYGGTIHPQYDLDNINSPHDIALLELKKTVNFTDFIKPICLLHKDDLAKWENSNKNLKVIGFGDITQENVNQSTKISNSVFITNNEKCRAIYEDIFLNVAITKEHLCAAGQDLCYMDAGSPLVIELRMNLTYAYYLVGIATFGLWDCGADGVPGVYTRVSSVYDWIEKTVKTPLII